MTQPTQPPLIPRAVLFGNPDKTEVKISPDGAHISYLAPVDGVLNVWVAPVADLDAAQPVTHDTQRGIRSYTWAFTNRHILYIQDKDGDENWRLYSVNLESGYETDLTPIEGVQARIECMNPQTPDEILISLNDRDPALHDLYRIDLTDNQRTLVLQNEGFMGFITNLDYAVRFGVRVTDEGDSEIMQRQGDVWVLFAYIALADTLTTRPLDLDRTGRTLYMKESRGRDTAALVAIDLVSGAQTLLADDPRTDAGAVLRHPVEQTVQAVSFTYLRQEWRVLDDAVAADFAFLQGAAEGELSVSSRTLDDQTWIVVYVLDNQPTRYYRYDRAAQQLTFLFTNRRELEEAPLARMHPVVIRTRDGSDMVSYYTLPVWCVDANEEESDSAPRPHQPLPMILYVHGGPWGRDEWGYDPYHQLLANRGYAVLSVNFRGSTGFGKAFINAGNLEWGRKMHDDLVDAVEWAIKEGIADRERVAIMGGSYGGYAALAGLTFTPDLFACAVDIVGPANLVTLLETVPAYWKPMVRNMYRRVGDPTTDAGRALLTERSPLTHVDCIRKPLLIGQGANDPRVKRAESDQIVNAMQAKNIPVTYLLYPDEGHGFARPENRLSFLAVTEAFLAKHLQVDRYEPVENHSANSTIQVLTGADDVPGLLAALAA